MINDRWRNEFFHQALSKVANNKVVLDIGAGTGILSAYALNSGAKFVYVVEEDRKAAEMAQFILSKCFDQSKFKVICGNFWTTDIENQIELNSVDVLVSETVGPGLFDQGMIQTWHCAKPFLKSNAVSIPDCLSTDAYIWHSDNADEIFSQEAPLIKDISTTIIEEENLLDSNFSQAVKEFNEYNETPSLIGRTQWKIIKNPKIPPVSKYENICKVTKDSLPELKFYDKPFPMHIQADLKFELELEDSKHYIVALDHKISFESTTIHLYDAVSMPWRFSPVFYITESGRTQFVWNPNFEIMRNKCDWFISTI
jgi:predicted RNA methylase